jgi:hypothetical protein
MKMISKMKRQILSTGILGIVMAYSCKQVSILVNSKEMCSTNPVRYVTTSGVNYSCKKTSSGLNMYSRGFAGISSNECTGVNAIYTATASGC